MRNDHERAAEAALERLFEAERRAPPVPPAALLARTLADAAALQPPPPGPRGWRLWLGLLGGAPGLGGLVTAAAAGLWLGLAPPAALPDFAGLVLSSAAPFGDESSEGEAQPGFGWLPEEIL